MIRIILSFLIFSCFLNIANSSERLELYFLSERLLSNKVFSFNNAIQFNTKSRSLGFEGIINNKIRFSIGDLFLKQSKFTLYNYDDEILRILLIGTGF